MLWIDEKVEIIAQIISWIIGLPIELALDVEKLFAKENEKVIA